MAGTAMRSEQLASQAGGSSGLTPTSQLSACGPLEEVAGMPSDGTTVLEAFRWHLDRHPDREHITLLDGEVATETVTYGRLWSDATETARGLQLRGIGR